MSIPELERLLDRWAAADPLFRDAVRQDPDAGISRAGYQLDDTEWAAIRDTDWTLPDEALRARMTDLSASPRPSGACHPEFGRQATFHTSQQVSLQTRQPWRGMPWRSGAAASRSKSSLLMTTARSGNPPSATWRAIPAARSHRARTPLTE